MLIETVLNTRPSYYASPTKVAFKEFGFSVIDFPCIEIVQSDTFQECERLILNIHPKSVIIFTSPQSVIYAFKSVSNWIIPSTAIVIAVGLKTSQILEQHSNVNVFVPETQNSQGIIDLLNGLKCIHSVALITANNGRDAIQKHVKGNNIKLSQINVYQRQLPSNEQRLNWLNDQSNKKTKLAILATSVSALINLKKLVNYNDWLKLQNQLFICASERIVKHAKSLDCIYTINTQSANPKVMANKLKEYLSSH